MTFAFLTGKVDDLPINYRSRSVNDAREGRREARALHFTRRFPRNAISCEDVPTRISKSPGAAVHCFAATS